MEMTEYSQEDREAWKEINKQNFLELAPEGQEGTYRAFWAAFNPWDGVALPEGERYFETWDVAQEFIAAGLDPYAVPYHSLLYASDVIEAQAKFLGVDWTTLVTNKHVKEVVQVISDIKHEGLDGLRYAIPVIMGWAKKPE